MAVYQYQQNAYAGASDGYVRYNISPALGSQLLPGSTISITGEAFLATSAMTHVSISLRFGNSAQTVDNLTYKIAVSSPAGTPKTFTMNCTIPELTVDQATRWFPNGEASVQLRVFFSVWTSASTANILNNAGNAANCVTLLRRDLNPTFPALVFARCKLSGSTYIRSDDGQNVLASSFRMTISNTSRADLITVCKLSFVNGQGATVEKSLTPSTLIAGYAETAPGILAGETFSLDANHTITITVGDMYKTYTTQVVVSRAFANLHLSGAATGGVAFGRFSSATLNNPKLESAYPVYAYGGIEGVTNYSTVEVDTGGKWIDGKPIYRRTISGTATFAKAQLVVATLGVALDTVIKVEGCVKCGANWRPIIYAYYANMNWDINVYVDIATGAITMGLGQGYTGSKPFHITVCYTKP